MEQYHYRNPQGVQKGPLFHPPKPKGTKTPFPRARPQGLWRAERTTK